MRALLNLLLGAGLLAALPAAAWAQQAQDQGAQQAQEAAQGGEAGAAEGGGEEFQQGGALEEEVVGEAEYVIEDAKKPITDVTLKPFEPIDSLISLREHALEKRSPSSVEKHISEIIKLHNNFLRRPVYPIEVVNEIELKVRQPRKKVDMWKIEIYNSAGKLVRTFEGKGNPPKVIKWDGFDDQGNPAVIPGELFHYRLTLSRRSGAKRRMLSEPFGVKGYWYEHNGVYGIIVDANSIFKEGREELTEGGEDRLHEILNIVKQYYKGENNLEVKVYTYPQFLAESRGEVIKRFFLKNAPLDPERLSITPGFFQGSGPRYERVEVKFR